MAFVPFNNTIKLEAVFTQDGQRIQNVHHYLVDETPNVDTAVSLCEAYKTWYNSYLKPIQTPDTSLVLIKATILETDNDPGVEYATGLPISGTNNVPSMPNNVTVAVKWLTGLRGRSYRGRTYHIGLAEDQVTKNNVIPAHLITLANTYGELISLTVDVGPAVMGIASRFHNNSERTVGVITPVTNVAVDATIDSQRRRLPGRGR